MIVKILRFFLSSRRAGAVFALGIVAFYGLLPWVVSLYAEQPEYFRTLALMALASGLAIWVGFAFPRPLGRLAHFRRFFINTNLLHLAVWGSFLIFAVYTFSTAKAIPIISVFEGASADELSNQRGALFKTREGREVVLLYLSAIFVSTLLPLSLVRMYLDGARIRHVCALIFLLFTVSSLHKGMFLNVAIPLVYYVVMCLRRPGRLLYSGAAACIVLMFIVTVLASGGRSKFDVEGGGRVAVREYFSARYVPAGAMDLLVWRIVAVPIFTASDSLLVFQEELGGQPLHGATSSLLSAALGKSRVLFERMVFAHQWGWNDIANSNAVFFVEGFVNFGWCGVIGFSLLVGRCLRWIHDSGDPAIRSLWLVFCLGLFSGGLIGMLLSNGYLLVVAMALWIKLGRRPKPVPAGNTLQPLPV